MACPTLRRAAVVLLLAVTRRGCGGAPPDPKAAPAVLVTQPEFRPGSAVPGLMHQTEQPNTAYAGGADAQPTPQLTFLASLHRRRSHAVLRRTGRHRHRQGLGTALRPADRQRDERLDRPGLSDLLLRV